MRFDKIRLSGQISVDFPIRGAQFNDPYIVKGIEGLGPSEVDVHMKRTLNAGGVHQASRPRYKEVELAIRLNPDLGVNITAGDLRDEVYALLTPVLNQSIRLSLMDNLNNVVAYIDGYLSRIVPNPFSKDPEIQVLMKCTQSYLTGGQDTYWEKTSNWSASPATLFTLPEMVGTAPAWFKFSYTLTNPINVPAQFEMWHNGALGATKKLIVMQGMAAGARLEFDSRPTSRYARYYPPGGGAYTNMLPWLSVESNWQELYPSHINQFAFNTVGVLDWVSFSPQYQGV